jgi:hypothetical protein
MKTTIAQQKEKIAALELRADIIEKAQKAADEYNQKKNVIQRKVSSDKTQIDQVVESGDNAAIRKLFIDRGMLVPKTGSSTSRSKGSTRNLSP